MAKCIKTVNEWFNNWSETLPDVGPIGVGRSLLEDESELMKRLEQSEKYLYVIISLYAKVKLLATNVSACSETAWNALSIQKKMLEALKNFEDIVLATISELKYLTIANSPDNTENNSELLLNLYLIYFNGISEQLRNLLNSVGRLSELNPSIYAEDQHRMLVSDSSTCIHCLTTIWFQAVKLSSYLKDPLKLVLSNLFSESKIDDQNCRNDDEDEMLFEQLGILQCITLCTLHTKVLVMDLLITSWVKYNRHGCNDDLLKGSPFLCWCHSKLFKKLVYFFMKCPNSKNIQYKSVNLSSLLDHFISSDSDSSFLANNIRQHSVITRSPVYKNECKENRALFVLWHLFSLSKLISQDANIRDCGVNQIKLCRSLIDSSFQISSKQTNQTVTPSGTSSSITITTSCLTGASVCHDDQLTLLPQNEERLKLAQHLNKHLLLFLSQNDTVFLRS